MSFRVQVFLGEIVPESVRVELYADGSGGGDPSRIAMERGDEIPGALHGYFYHASAPSGRPASDFTARVIPFHPDAFVPMEAGFIAWQH